MENEITVKEYCSLNDILPVCAICEAREIEKARQNSEAEKARRAEEARKSLIGQRIYESGILEKINQTLIKHGYLTITLGNCYKGEAHQDHLRWLFAYYYDDIVEGVSGKELYDFIYQQYKNAGYKINNYVYSPSYWKYEYITIYAECEEKK